MSACLCQISHSKFRQIFCTCYPRLVHILFSKNKVVGQSSRSLEEIVAKYNIFSNNDMVVMTWSDGFLDCFSLVCMCFRVSWYDKQVCKLHVDYLQFNTKYLICLRSTPPTLSINDHTLPIVSTVRDLEITDTSNLSPSAHVHYVILFPGPISVLQLFTVVFCHVMSGYSIVFLKCM